MQQRTTAGKRAARGKVFIAPQDFPRARRDRMRTCAETCIGLRLAWMRTRRTFASLVVTGQRSGARHVRVQPDRRAWLPGRRDRTLHAIDGSMHALAA
jgi:hypothetical protein